MKRIILMGPQGSGKTTQGDKIADFLGIKMIVTGDVLRKEIRARTDLGQKIEQTVNSGELITNELMIDLMLGHIGQSKYKNGFVIDGFPRDLEQARALDAKYQLDKVFNIEISDEEAVQRLSQRRTCPGGHVFHLKYNPPEKEDICDDCGQELIQRKDDQPDTVRKRLNIYRQETTKLLEHYKQQGKLVVFDGKRSITEVSKDILAYLKENAG